MISIPAPREAADLTEVSAAVGASRIEVDEIALRRPTLDDAFIALTGKPTVPQAETHELEEVAA